MSDCVASGYSIFADGKLYKFDQASNKKIEEFLRQPDSKLQVVVKAEKVGKELKLVSIENHNERSDTFHHTQHNYHPFRAKAATCHLLFPSEVAVR